MNRSKEDLTGKRFHRWTAIRFSHFDVGSRWVCKCDCGTIKTIRRNGLLTGSSKSCGCLNKENTTSINTLKNSEAAKNILFRDYCNNAKNRGKIFNLTKEYFLGLVIQNCHYCGTPPFNIKKSGAKEGGEPFLYNGIDRKDNSEGYTIENSLPCCKICNQAKHTFKYEDFIKWINTLSAFRIKGPF